MSRENIHIIDFSRLQECLISGNKAIIQFIRCEAGQGKAILDDITHQISNGFSIIVPAGAKHNIINTSSDKPLKLYTLYSPPNHHDGVIHKTKADAEANEEHFDGTTTE